MVSHCGTMSRCGMVNLTVAVEWGVGPQVSLWSYKFYPMGPQVSLELCDSSLWSL